MGLLRGELMPKFSWALYHTRLVKWGQSEKSGPNHTSARNWGRCCLCRKCPFLLKTNWSFETLKAKAEAKEQKPTLAIYQVLLLFVTHRTWVKPLLSFVSRRRSQPSRLSTEAPPTTTRAESRAKLFTPRERFRPKPRKVLKKVDEEAKTIVTNAEKSTLPEQKNEVETENIIPLLQRRRPFAGLHRTRPTNHFLEQRKNPDKTSTTSTTTTTTTTATTTTLYTPTTTENVPLETTTRYVTSTIEETTVTSQFDVEQTTKQVPNTSTELPLDGTTTFKVIEFKRKNATRQTLGKFSPRRKMLQRKKVGSVNKMLNIRNNSIQFQSQKTCFLKACPADTGLWSVYFSLFLSLSSDNPQKGYKFTFNRISFILI